jgi:hypothetical protein
MGRMYSGGASAAVTGANVDLLEINAPSDATVIVHEITITQSSDTDTESARITIQRSTGSSGSGGSSNTPNPLEVGDPAFGGTCEVHNTTRATTLVMLRSEGFNWLSGYQYLPTPETRIKISPSGRLVLNLEGTPADSLTIEVTYVIEEVGG